MDLSFNGPEATSQASPYRVWVNSGHCEPGKNGNLDTDLPVPPASPNYSAGKITCQRDLENFFRLWICGVPQLPAGQGYAVTMSMSPSSGNPAINLYYSCETNGGIGYLTDTNIAATQTGSAYYNNALCTISNSQSYTLQMDGYGNLLYTHFLFEGAGIGSGELVLTISQNGNVVAQTGVWLDLHDIKDFYEQAHIANVPTTFPAMVNTTNTSTFVSDHAMPPNPAETNQLIVFVHGWRMGVFDYEDFSDTMFKRLYWAGYKGRFASLRWPTLSADDYRHLSELLSYTTYNRSEHIAFDSGAGTCAYFDWLRGRFPDYSIGVAAHSMGNIVMMEALKDQLAEGHSAIDNYVMMQAAVPAHCYQTNLANYNLFTAAEANYPTPDVYRGYPGNIATAVNGQIVNFFNTNDFALVSGSFFGANVSWEGNEVAYKPDGHWNYSSDGTNCFETYGTYRVVTDPREKMAFVARPRSKAAGALKGVAGQVGGGELDLTAQYHFFGNANEHSAEFNWNIQRVGPFYTELMTGLFPQHP
jgi:hypothetical protein